VKGKGEGECEGNEGEAGTAAWRAAVLGVTKSWTQLNGSSIALPVSWPTPSPRKRAPSLSLRPFSRASSPSQGELGAQGDLLSLSLWSSEKDGKQLAHQVDRTDCLLRVGRGWGQGLGWRAPR